MYIYMDTSPGPSSGTGRAAQQVRLVSLQSGVRNNGLSEGPEGSGWEKTRGTQGEKPTQLGVVGKM